MDMTYSENETIKDQYVVYREILIRCTFSTKSVDCFISCLKQTEEMNHYQYKYTF